MSYKLHIYDDAESSSRAVAELIKENAVSKHAQGQKLNIAVSGGSMPRQLFTLLGDEYEELMPWKSIRFFWVDERCVEPTDPDSNYGMTYDMLLRRTFIPAENVFRMKGEDHPDDEAQRYQKVLWKELPAKDGVPVFDLVLVGVGQDGHTASIFPHDMSLLNSDFFVGVSAHPLSGQKRITLTGNTINNANQIVFLVNGKNKSTILKQIINKEHMAKLYPASFIHDRAGNADFYVDKVAVAEL